MRSSALLRVAERIPMRRSRRLLLVSLILLLPPIAHAAHTPWSGRADFAPASAVQGASVTILLNVWNTGDEPVYVSEVSLGACWESGRTVAWTASQQGGPTRIDPDAAAGFRREVIVPREPLGDCRIEARVLADEDQASPWDLEDYEGTLAVRPPFPVGIQDAAREDRRVDFSATVTGGQAPYAYRWAFGDGGSSTEARPTHTYAAVGTYTVTLRVTDAAGEVAAVAKEVDAREKPPNGGGDGGGHEENEGGNPLPAPGLLALLLVAAGAAAAVVAGRRRS